jgi:hypothetical protein
MMMKKCVLIYRSLFFLMSDGPLTKKRHQSDAAVAARARNVILARAAKEAKRQASLPLKPVKPKPGPVKPVAVKPKPAAAKSVRVAEEPEPLPARKERPVAKPASRRMRKVVTYETDSSSKSESGSDDEPQKPVFGRRFGGGGGSSAFQSVFSS